MAYIAEAFGNSQYFHDQAGHFGNIPALDEVSLKYTAQQLLRISNNLLAKKVGFNAFS